MTQVNIATIELGWGDLKLRLVELKSLEIELQKEKEKARETQTNLHHLVREINEARRKRVLDLLKVEKRVICLLHPLVFRESGIEESLVPEEFVKVVQMRKFWTRDIRYYDSDPYTEHYESQYETSGCKFCRSVVSRGSILEDNQYTHTAMRDQKPVAKKPEELYPVEIIDKISTEYFQMPPVTIENLQSL